ncbi:MAG: ComF family protein [Ferruginibacter sp.]
MQALSKLTDGLFHLLYPHTCTGCGSDLLSKENMLCARCVASLPHTNYALHTGNPVEKTFWGRIPLAAASSQFFFAKESLVQHLIHQLKYKGNTDIGNYLGLIMGQTLLNSGRFTTIDALVPLPLYPDKERKRGYNQAAIICKGMSEVMNIPIISNNLLRKRFTETQTKKHRMERWENVEGSFVVKNEAALKGKHILLVDDVVTTGATLEASGAAS